ncbi:MAG: ATP-binding cassette domain-containing protein [Clostridiales bacterium]|nr:ATP-binding cassette domain-containing protein [Clostridiales bacterium]
MVRMAHIDKTYNPGSVHEKAMFRDFSLQVRRGDFVSVVGSNGSGKTTLLNLLCGSLPVDAGLIELGGRALTGLPEFRRSRFIGRVFQDPAKGTCGGMTILENMALADNKGRRYGLGRGVNRGRAAAYREMLAGLGLGLENALDQRVGSLSGGQRQALALLIATMTPIDLLILDEHTAALDPRSSEMVMQLTDRIVRERKITTFMVTHNLKHAIQYGNRILMMHQGGIVLDAADEDKAARSVDDLLKIFTGISVELGN